MRNLAHLMQKAKAVQEEIAAMKDALESMRFEGESGGGAVKAVVNGRGELLEVMLNPAMAASRDGEDMALLEDLIVVAVNAAQAKRDSVRDAKMKEISGGLGLPPGLDLPF